MYSSHHHSQLAVHLRRRQLYEGKNSGLLVWMQKQLQRLKDSLLFYWSDVGYSTNMVLFCILLLYSHEFLQLIRKSAFWLQLEEQLVVVCLVTRKYKLHLLIKLAKHRLNSQSYLVDVTANTAQIVQQQSLGRRQEYLSFQQHLQVLLRSGPKVSAAFLDVDAQFHQRITWPQIDPLHSRQNDEEKTVKSAHFGKLRGDEPSYRLNQMQFFLPKRQKECIEVLQFPDFVQHPQSSKVLNLTLGRQQQYSSFLNQLSHSSSFCKVQELP